MSNEFYIGYVQQFKRSAKLTHATKPEQDQMLRHQTRHIHSQWLELSKKGKRNGSKGKV